MNALLTPKKQLFQRADLAMFIVEKVAVVTRIHMKETKMNTIDYRNVAQLSWVWFETREGAIGAKG